VDSVITDRLAVLWKAYGSRTGLRRGEFRSYFKGRDVGSALILSEPCRFARQVALADLRASRCMNRPPQSYSYIDATTGDQLLRLAGRSRKLVPGRAGWLY
jgi:predicted transcriptional regulator